MEHVMQPSVLQAMWKALAQGTEPINFPPQLVCPENELSDTSLVALFSRPLLVWIPESVNQSGKPFCVVSGCTCVKDYKQRVWKTAVPTTLPLFQPLSSCYTYRNPDVMIHLPFVTCKKIGLSRD
ncbi:hypothetical protein GQ600_1538 [Phytophthora cactorum]|nr:hypothetical protein GQ600_1538 [Phytophthora cactorum]